jgi:hypothetical protein
MTPIHRKSFHHSIRPFIYHVFSSIRDLARHFKTESTEAVAQIRWDFNEGGFNGCTQGGADAAKWLKST